MSISNYRDVLLSVESVFANEEVRVDLAAAEIGIYPANFKGTPTEEKWIRINVLPFNSELTYSKQLLSGQIVCNIFIVAGEGVQNAHKVADLLDNFLSKKIIGNVQTFNSTITTMGIDPHNSGLFRVDYAVNFKQIN